MTPPPDSPDLLAILRSPVTGSPLHWDDEGVLSDGDLLWPCIEGIPFLRIGRDALREAAVSALRRGDRSAALALLLADRKDATIPRADLDSVRAVVERACSARQSMEGLGYGGLAPYFLHRWSQPTYLSGLALLEAHAPEGGTLCELGCGVGHFLRSWKRSGAPAIGADVVFSHLWLARRFTAPDARLICFDAEGPFPLATDCAAVTLAQDSFHYFRRKDHVFREMRRISTGPVLLGHVHNAEQPNPSPGFPLSAEGYAELLEPQLSHDDAELTEAALAGRPPRSAAVGELEGMEAFGFLCGSADATALRPSLTIPPRGTILRPNPLLSADGFRWPHEKFELEYSSKWPYLADMIYPPPDLLAAGLAGEVGTHPAVDRLARRRVLLDLPERWL